MKTNIMIAYENFQVERQVENKIKVKMFGDGFIFLKRGQVMNKARKIFQTLYFNFDSKRDN